MAKMTFNLDKSAMDVLFPEGSEARLELRKAIIRNYAKGVYSSGQPPAEVKAVVAEVIREDREALAAFSKAHMAQEIKKYASSDWKGTLSMLNQLNDIIDKAFEARTSELAGEFIRRKLADKELTIEEVVNTVLDRRLSTFNHDIRSLTLRALSDNYLGRVRAQVDSIMSELQTEGVKSE